MSQDNMSKDHDVFEQVALALRPAELGATQRQRMRASILQRVHADSAAPPAGTVTRRASEAQWLDVAPLIQARMLHVDADAGTQTVLLRVQPGGMYPRHYHSKDEEFIVLEGECHIGTHRLCAGDVHIAKAGTWHEDITTQVGTLVMVRGEYPSPQPSPQAAGAR